MSELLKRLERQIQVAADPRSHGELQARRACYLARIGRFDEAKAIISNLRQTATGVGFERVSIWIILVEGVLGYFESLGSGARDRIVRAQLLSLSIRDRRLVQITSAWRSHIEFEASNFDAMHDALEEVFLKSPGEETDDESIARASLTLAYSFTLVGNRDSAQVWYKSARDHALIAGDQATIEAIIHNRASFNLANLRIQRCYRQLTPQEVDDCRLEISSARNFQTLINIGSLTTLTELCEARHTALSGNYGEGVRLLSSLRSRKPFAQNNYSTDIIDIEVAYLLALLGRFDEARECMNKVTDPACSALDPDDRMIAAWLRLKLAELDAGYFDVSAAELEFRVRREEFERFAAELKDAILPFEQRTSRSGQS